jgi:tetratricopeptide (TPR) repeat protein
MRRTPLLALIPILLMVTSSVTAEPPRSASHCATAAVGWVPPDVLTRPVELRKGLGPIYEVVTARSKEAQAYYQQGLAYLHSFVWIEAARSFNQALRLDSKMAMAQLGMSRAYSGLEDEKSAWAALERAEKLKGSVAPWEQRRIKIRRKQLEAIADPKKLEKHQAYKGAIEEALGHDPNDVELWIQRGNAEEPKATGRGQRGTAASVAFYEAALNRKPDAFAAHHYLIHSYEGMNQIPMALKHGKIYSRLAPAIPHAHHMYGHDLRRVGRIEEAIKMFRKAETLERAYYQKERIPRDFDWHHIHNLNLLAKSYQQLGQMNVTSQILKDAFSIPTKDEIFYIQRRDWPEFLVTRGRYQEALDAPRVLSGSEWISARIVGRSLAGGALLGMNRLKEARAELTLADGELKTLEAEAKAKPVIGAKRSRATAEFVSAYVEALRGELLMREGKHAEGRKVLKKLAKTVRAAPGPDAWTQALFWLESMGRIGRAVGDWELAEFSAEQMMDHDPAFGGAHYARALVHRRRGEMEGYRRELGQAKQLWKKADRDLPELVDIERQLSGRPVSGSPMTAR